MYLCKQPNAISAANNKSVEPSTIALVSSHSKSPTGAARRLHVGANPDAGGFVPELNVLTPVLVVVFEELQDHSSAPKGIRH
jgi:hypothetical protein